MTIDDKTTLACFLDLTEDYLRDGHKRNAQINPAAMPAEINTVHEKLSSLPLAYQIDENEAAESYTEESVEPPSSVEHSPPLYDSLDDSLMVISSDITVCQTCGLAATRTLVVPGEGVERPLVMVIGEGPGADEDKAGRPFVGRAGQLLDKMLESIGLSRNKNCFIANMIKCRPPGNRDPGPDEIAACYPYLERQITLLRPRIILCAGRVAAQNLLKTGTGINALRGKFTKLRIGENDIPVLCTFHPSAILRDESLKRPAWEDLKLLKSHLGNTGNGDN